MKNAHFMLPLIPNFQINARLKYSLALGSQGSQSAFHVSLLKVLDAESQPQGAEKAQRASWSEEPVWFKPLPPALSAGSYKSVL